LETAYYVNNNNSFCDTCLVFAKYSKLVNEPEHLGKILDICLDVLFQLKAKRNIMLKEKKTDFERENLFG